MNIRPVLYGVAGFACAGVAAQNMAPGHGPRHEPIAPIGAIVTVKPQHFSGHCPTTITFTGDITRGDVGYQPDAEVAYTWLRSDNATGPIKRAKLVGHSLTQVTETWTLGASYSGWERIKVWWPSNPAASTVLSWKMPFDVTCR